MTKNIFKRGFTLIELLVVIAIIGILAAVVLASLNSARDKGEDAAIQAALNNARAQAELFYNDNGRSYDGVCAAAQTANPGGIATLVANANDSGGGATAATCGDEVGEWAVEKQLNQDSGAAFYCVDYTGLATTTVSSTLNPAAATPDLVCG